MRYPFTLYKVKSRNETVWHARFWDEEAQKYAHSRTTGIPVEGKKARRREAEDVAKKIYDELVLNLNQPKTTPLQQTRTNTANLPLVQYLRDFWTTESEYARFKRDVQKTPLSPSYIEMNYEDVRRHVEPFPGFSDISVGNLNKALLKKWLIWLAGRRIIRQKKDGTIMEGDVISGRRANTVLQSVRVAIRWAVDNEELQTDPFRKLGEVSGNSKEKGVLTFEERKKLTQLPVSDYRSRLVMLLGSYCGLRRGEMRGLQWGDIANGIITVQHNFQNKEGLKQPKCNSVRKTPVTSDVQKLLDIANKYALNPSPDSFVLESPKFPGKPLGNTYFKFAVRKELSGLGITLSQQRERVLSCHSLRHTFVTLAQLSGIPDVEIRAMTGQKSEKVLKRYSHVPQVLDFETARKKLEADNTTESKAVNE